MKKGMTIIELLIAISILAIIIVVVMALYQVAVREYPLSIQKNKMQINLNFAADGFAQNAKNSFGFPESYNPGSGNIFRSSSTVIMELPALDTDDNFLYEINIPKKDYYIYSLSNGNLIRRVYGNEDGRSAGANGEEKIILTDVSNFNCTYSNQVSGQPTSYKNISCEISLLANVVGKEINFNITKTATARNAL